MEYNVYMNVPECTDQNKEFQRDPDPNDILVNFEEKNHLSIKRSSYSKEFGLCVFLFGAGDVMSCCFTFYFQMS